MISHKMSNDILPGIYDISNEDYHNGAGISRSGIMLMKKSPYHYYKKYISNDKPPIISSKALEFGSAFHPYILEPDSFANDYAYEDRELDCRRTEDKKWRAEFKKKNENKKIVQSKDYFRLLEMSQSINNNSMSVALIKNAQFEKTIYWTDQDTGVLCKCRPDIFHSNIGIVSDIKTTANAGKRAFERSIYEYGYHIQAAMIADGYLQVFGKELDSFYFICVENVWPYCTVNYPLSKIAIDIGRREYKEELVKFKECLTTNVWPAYEDLQEVSLPKYILNQGENNVYC